MKYDTIRNAYDFVSAGEPFEHVAYVRLSTGEAFFKSDEAGMDELPEDIDERVEDYRAIPHKYDLDLGQDLVWRFVRQEIPDLEDRIRSFFRRQGAYGRFKDYLAERGILEKWYEYGEQQTHEALHEWCKDNNVELEEET
jgi:hypothetical protein